MKTEFSDVKTKLKASRQFAAKISYKRKNCMQLATEIESYLKENRFFKEEEPELYKLAETLKTTGQTIYAVFKQGKRTDVSAAAVIYSKHRFDEVWLYRKSQIIRSRYAKFFANHPEYSSGIYRPCHLVLTVPHTSENGWKGKQFYGRELVNEFARLREKWWAWKEFVHAGEYGVEVTKGRYGLHIHIHSLVFVQSDISLNNFRNLLKEEWKRRVKDTDGQGGVIWLETLYYYERKANGQYESLSRWAVDMSEAQDIIFYWSEEKQDFVQTTGYAYTGRGAWSEAAERIKNYWTEKWTPEQFLNGVLECIKYHFKMDSVKNEDGTYNIPLIRDILNNSRNMRFYSRYGAFYNEAELSFNKITGNEDEALQGDTANFMNNLVNPFTEQPAAENEFSFQWANPERLDHRKKPSYQYNHKTDRYFRPCEGETPKEILRNHFNKKFQ